MHFAAPLSSPGVWSRNFGRGSDITRKTPAKNVNGGKKLRVLASKGLIALELDGQSCAQMPCTDKLLTAMDGVSE